MESQENNILPLRSINGRKCLTKCYPKGTTYFHPILLTGVAEISKDSCAIEPVHTKNPIYFRENDIIYADTCNLDDNKTHIIPNELESVLLSFYFNPGDFLSGIYNLHTFDDVIYWTLENDYLPFNTIKRVHDCAWKFFGPKFNNLSSTVLEYYYNISKTYWLREYSEKLQNNYSINLISDDNLKTQDLDNLSDEFYNIISAKIYNYNYFIELIKKYFDEFTDKWDMVKSHYTNLKKFIFEQIKNNISALNK
uniref:Uncharacterized protein n=1 Tax=Moumouvirus sp. 'Monve' TaxID=1128131 RepID=H2EEA2_9VIRU|nr:hypothetical protein mv_L520 [Moumouvirus Monve]